MTERNPITIQEIKRASVEDVDIVWRIIDFNSQWLLKNGHSHWADFYTRDRVWKKIKSADVRIAFVNDLSVATITMDTKRVSYYTHQDMEKFAEPDAEAIYISALAVLPDYHGRGIASQLMDMAETEAGAGRIKYARLDCKALYPELVNFYRKRDYVVMGAFTDSKDNYEPYFLMEKQLITSLGANTSQ